MKILHILTDSGVGGAGVLLENMLTHSSLPKSCFAVVLPRGAAMAPRLSARGFRVFPILRGADRSLALRDLFRLVAVIRREKPHILHTHASLAGRIAGWLAGVPIRLATRHCAYKTKPGRHRFSAWVHRMADKSLTTCTVATAGAAAENLMALGIPPEKILLIRNGARAVPRLSGAKREELRRKLSISEGSFVVGICARLAPVKDHMTLLRAAKLLLEEQEGYHVLIVGGGEEEAALRAAAKEMGIAAHVTFTGYAEDPAPYLNLFDVAVNCSVGTETSCLALSEAMSLGIPCVASRFGGNTEMVREGENGLLFQEKSEGELATCLSRLKNDPALYCRLSGGARRRFLHDLRAEEMAHAYDHLYLALYDAPRPHGELHMPPKTMQKRFSPFMVAFSEKM